MHDAKNELRRAIRAARRQRTRGEIIRAGRLIATHVREILDGVHVVAAFAATPDEPATEFLLAELARHGCEIRLPLFDDALARTWARYSPGDPLSAAAPGRPPLPAGAVLPEESIAEVDLILTPALAVDQSGTRLGQGGGWYDRALLLRRPEVPAYGVVFAEEFVRGPLPRYAHDVPLDGVLTPAGFSPLPATDRD